MATDPSRLTPISIVAFAPQHAEGVFDLILSIQREEFALPITRADQPDLASIPSFYQGGAGNFWVALDDGRVVGTIGLLDIGNREAALRKMFVASRYRGREAGVALQLLKTLVGWARSQALLRIYLGTTSRFLAAHRFYEKNGFREIAAAELPATFPVMKVDTKFYLLTPGPVS